MLKAHLDAGLELVLLREEIGQVELRGIFGDGMVAPRGRRAEIVEAVPLDDPDGVLPLVEVADRVGDNILRLQVGIEVLSVRIPADMRSVPAQLQLKKGLLAQRLGP